MAVYTSVTEVFSSPMNNWPFWAYKNAGTQWIFCEGRLCIGLTGGSGVVELQVPM